MTGNTKGGRPDLIDRVNAKCGELKINKQDMADISGINRSTISRYLNRKLDNQQGEQVSKLEEWFEGWLAEVGEPQAPSPAGEAGQEAAAMPFCKRENFETTDFNGVTAICTMCQEGPDMGLIIGNPGYGKTYALQNYAKLPKVAYIECNDVMNCKDIVRRLEQAVGLPKGVGSVDERITALSSFLAASKGYLLIIDEADKLMSRYSIQKMDIIRYIVDRTKYRVGLVLAGEPSLKAKLETYDGRFYDRIGVKYSLEGLTRRELERYFEGYGVEEEAFEELCHRAYGRRRACFRLLDKTLNNIMRILKITGKNVITCDVLKEASSMMNL